MKTQTQRSTATYQWGMELARDGKKMWQNIINDDVLLKLVANLLLKLVADSNVI